MTDNIRPPQSSKPRNDEEHRSLEWLDDEGPVEVRPYVPGGADLPPQVDVDTEPQQPAPPTDE